MSIENILSRLAKVKKTGREYKAICPVHQGNTENLYLRQAEDGKVIINCFSCGATGIAVVEALGLKTDELFPVDHLFEYDRMHKLKKFELEDKMVVTIYEQDKESGRSLSHADFKRYKLAKSRLGQLAA